MEAVEEYTTIESIFIRHRNCLMLRGKFTPIYTDYYLQLMQHGLQQPQKLDWIFKELIAYFTLHLVARPWAERYAWTVSLRAPRANFFVTGASLDGTVVGRAFTENIREQKTNLFISQLYQENAEPRTSTIHLQSSIPAEWIEDYYKQSEQRLCRCVELEDEVYVLIVAQPDADIEWLMDLDPTKVAEIESTEETKLLETRKFKFHCGCTLEKVLPAISAWKDRPDELFGDKSEIEITCPRCAAHYLITKDQFLNELNPQSEEEPSSQE